MFRAPPGLSRQDDSGWGYTGVVPVFRPGHAVTFALLGAVAGCSIPTGTIPAGDDNVAGPVFPTCQPVATVDEPFYTEGETVQVSYSCTTGKRRSAFHAASGAEAPGASLDPESWTLTWPTDLDDGGRHVLVLRVWPAGHEDDPDLLETAVATVWVADAFDDPANVPVVANQYTEEWGLPVLHLDPSGPLDEVDYTPATITHDGVTYAAEMKLRGSASLYYPKNSFTLHFPTPNLDVEDQGLDKKDHLVLVTNFDDNSYVRQKLAYDLWAEMADYWGRDRLTPRSFFAVVYMHGEYFGLYLAADRVDEEFIGEMGLDDMGNVYKAINHDANFRRTDANGTPKVTLHQGYEKKDGLPGEDQPGAFDDLEELVAFCADTDHATFAATADQWIRVDEFLDWFLFVHWTASDDSGGKNSYLYNDPDQQEFRYAPWDFNHSFGQGWYTYRIAPDTYNDFRWTNEIFVHFQDHTASNAEQWYRFGAMRDDGPLNVSWMLARLDEYYAVIDRSAERDWSVWEERYFSYWEGDNDTTYWEERDYLVDWLIQRDAWMLAYHP